MNRYHNIHRNRKEKEFELMQIDLKCVSMANRMMSCLLSYRNSVCRIEVEWRCNRNIILPQPYPAQIPRKESILLSRRHCLSSRNCPSPFPIPYLSSSSEMRQRGTYSIHLYHSLSEKGRGRQNFRGSWSRLALDYYMLLSGPPSILIHLFRQIIYMMTIAIFNLFIIRWLDITYLSDDLRIAR